MLGTSVLMYTLSHQEIFSGIRVPFQATGDTVVTLSRSGVTKRYCRSSGVSVEQPEVTVVALGYK